MHTHTQMLRDIFVCRLNTALVTTFHVSSYAPFIRLREAPPRRVLAFIYSWHSVIACGSACAWHGGMVIMMIQIQINVCARGTVPCSSAEPPCASYLSRRAPGPAACAVDAWMYMHLVGMRHEGHHTRHPPRTTHRECRVMSTFTTGCHGLPSRYADGSR